MRERGGERRRYEGQREGGKHMAYCKMRKKVVLLIHGLLCIYHSKSYVITTILLLGEDIKRGRETNEYEKIR